MTLLSEIIDSSGVASKHVSTRPDELMIHCPFCPERGNIGDKRLLLGVNLKDGRAHCFKCGWRSTALLTTARELCRVFGLELRRRSYRDRLEEQKPTAEVEEEREYGLPREYERFTGSSDIIERAARKYLARRGVSTLQLVKHHIGFAAAGNMSWRILFPVYDAQRRIHGCVGRAFVDGVKPKYLNTSGMRAIWGAWQNGSVGVLVEGVLDALMVESALMSTIGHVALAQLGSSLTEFQFRQLRRYERIIVLPDRDRAGVTGAAHLADKCVEHGIKVDMAIPCVLDGEDPGSISCDEIRDAVALAKPWGKTSQWRMRILREDGRISL